MSLLGTALHRSKIIRRKREATAQLVLGARFSLKDEKKGRPLGFPTHSFLTPGDDLRLRSACLTERSKPARNPCLRLHETTTQEREHRGNKFEGFHTKSLCVFQVNLWFSDGENTKNRYGAEGSKGLLWARSTERVCVYIKQIQDTI